MTLSDFNFTNENNAAMSLRTIAELIRSGSLRCNASSNGGILRLEITDVAATRARKDVPVYEENEAWTL